MLAQYLQGRFVPSELCAGTGLLQVSALTGCMLLQVYLAARMHSQLKFHGSLAYAVPRRGLGLVLEKHLSFECMYL